MAIIKFANPKAGKPYALKAILDYITNPEKTENGALVSAQDCLTESAYAQMLLTKEAFGKTNGRQYVHFIQSFAPDDRLTPEITHEIGQKLMACFDYQGVVATHTNTGILHNHIILNSVRTSDGLKWQLSKEMLQGIKDKSDELCKEYGLSVIKRTPSQFERDAAKDGVSWKANLAEVIGVCVRKSTSRAEFAHNLAEYGIEVEFRQFQLIFTVPKWNKACGSDKLLGYGDFTKENIEQYLGFNAILLENGMANAQLVSEVCRTLGASLRPDEPDSFQRDVLRGKPLSAL